jgi:predicted enzyme related to lactoylglutathione lyase
MFQPASGPSGGVFKRSDDQTPTMWTAYVRVPNIDATLARAAQLGGKVIVPKSPIPGMGHFAIFADPTGAVLGLFQGLK